MDATSRQQQQSQSQSRMAPAHAQSQSQSQMGMTAPAGPSASHAPAAARSASSASGHASGSGSSVPSGLSSDHARSLQLSLESFFSLLDSEVRSCSVGDAPPHAQQAAQPVDLKEHATRLFAAYTQLEMNADRIAIYLAECERKLLLEMHEPAVTLAQVTRAQEAHAAAHPPPGAPTLHTRGAFVRAHFDALQKRAHAAAAEHGSAEQGVDDIDASDLLHASQTSTVAAFATPVSASPSLLTPNSMQSPHAPLSQSQAHLTPNSVPAYSPNHTASSPITAPMET